MCAIRYQAPILLGSHTRLAGSDETTGVAGRGGLKHLDSLPRPGMGLIAELRLTSPELFLYSTSRTYPEAVISVEYRTGDGRLLLSATGEDVEDLTPALEADETIEESWPVATFDDRRFYGGRVAFERPTIPEVTLAEGVNILENAVVDGDWYLKLELSDKDALVAIGDFCREHGVSMNLERLYGEDSPEGVGTFGLTPAQREALLVAHERGYFNDPRDVTLEELADDLGVSATGLGRRMRRALSALIERTLKSER